MIEMVAINIKKVLPKLQVPGNRSIIYEIRANYNEEEIKLLKQAKIDVLIGIENSVRNFHKL